MTDESLKDIQEREIRFYCSSEYLGYLDTYLTAAGCEHVASYYELTEMYDNPNPDYSFYDPSVDGRLRLRTSNDQVTGKSVGLLSWKQRIPESSEDIIRREVEKEVVVDNPYNLREILIDVLKCELVSYYERIRHKYLLEDKAEITIDEFAYGIMFEIEAKNCTDDELLEIVERLNIDLSKASPLSCDDMYNHLCELEGIVPSNNITESTPNMPKIKDGLFLKP